MDGGTAEFQFADERVREATGRGRGDWFALLDDAGAKDLSHADIARWLVEEHDVDGWWAQTVTVDYELARGLRGRHERPDGYAISKSKTLPVPVAAVFDAWVDDASRGQWLDGALEVTSTQPNRSVRGRWEDGTSRVAVYLTAKGDAKAQVNVQHEKLPDAGAADKAKAAWSDRLAALATWLT